MSKISQRIKVVNFVIYILHQLVNEWVKMQEQSAKKNNEDLDQGKGSWDNVMSTDWTDNKEREGRR